MARIGLGLLVALALACVPASAPAAPTSRQAAFESYLQLSDSRRVPVGWTGNVATCDAGTESAASIEATRVATNILRDYAGLGPVTFDPAYNRMALDSSLMMLAANRLDHYPDASWRCYSDSGRDGAGKSNLFLGQTAADAAVGFVDDEGVASLGHRRWLLNPKTSVFGTGSTSNTNSIYVVSPENPAAIAPEIVAWPPAGHVPWPLVFVDWSASISLPGAVNVTDAQVAVSLDGQPLVVGDVYPHGQGMGTGPMISWRTNVPAAARERDARADVVISNVRVDGAPRELRYSIELIPILLPVPGPFTAERVADKVNVTWQAATERGIPVTGYRIELKDGFGNDFDTLVGPEARKATLTYDQPNYVARVRVIPLSRAGSPEVEPLSVLPGSATGEPGGGSGTASPLRLKRARLVGRTMRFTVTTDPAATGRMTATVRARGGKARKRAAISKGKAVFKLRLSRRLASRRPLKVTVSYPGSTTVPAAKLRFSFR